MFPRLESHLHWIWSELCAHLQPWGLFDLWAPVSTNWESATPKTYVTWCFDLPFARSVQDSYSRSPSSYLDVHLLCLAPQHKPICHTLRLNHLKLGPWKFPASTLSSRQSNLFSFGRETRRGNSFFIQSYEISGNKVGNPGSLLPSTCSMRPGWHLWFYSRFRSWFVHRWHVVHTCFDFARQVDREEVLMSPIVLSSIHKSTRSYLFTLSWNHEKRLNVSTQIVLFDQRGAGKSTPYVRGVYLL